MKNSFALAVLVSLIFSFFKHILSRYFFRKGRSRIFSNGGYSSLESGHATSFGGGFALGGIMELGFTSSVKAGD